MELIGVIKKRRSICRFKPDEIPKEDIYDIVRAACLAPSSHNKQMWCFYSYKQQEGVEILFNVAGRIRNLNS